MTDVAVYGATACGVMAAVAARAAGAETVLVEPGHHIGGMTSGGLSWTDVGDTRVLGGLARRFHAAVADHYGAPLWEVKGPEPHVAERLLEAMLEGVDVRLGEPELPDAAVVVDASYEGDAMAARGVPYAVGREARDLHGERWAGRQPAYRPSRHNFSVLLDPFGEDGALLPGIREPELDEHGWPDERVGEGDGGLQAYAYRVCLTHADERLPFEPPDGYDEREFELLSRYLDATGDEQPLGLVRDLLPHEKCDVNSIGPVSLNVLDGSNRDYLEGDRAAVVEHHRRYTLGFLWTLAERGLLEGWGFPPDEFGGGLPHQLYVREARRLRGERVLTEHDLVGARPQEDVVALGSYNIDVREVERTWRYLPEFDRTPAVFNEGYLSVAVPPYPIPYRSLTPRREDADDLLVPLCLSASHVAFASVRMEPTLMLLGQAAGTAAAQAARRSVAVQDVDVAQLQDDLRDAGTVLAA
jgi:FAD dependent oxidoreductase